MADLQNKQIKKKVDTVSMSNEMNDLPRHIPKKFVRMSRALEEITNFKAIEFRNFTLGVVVLKGHINKTLYDNFLKLYVAYRLLLAIINSIVCENNINETEKSLKKFVREYKKIYGESKITYI